MSKPSDLSSLVDELTALRSRVDAQEAELVDLRHGGGRKPVSRRHLLRGLAGLGAGGAIGVATAESAAAANGDALLVGEANSATATTDLTAPDGANVGSLLRLQADNGWLLEANGGDGNTGVVTSGFVGMQATGTFAGVAGRGSGQGIGVIASTLGPDALAFIAVSEHGPAMTAESGDGVTLCLRPAATSGPPTVEYPVGAVLLDASHDLWLCTVAGSPGSWTRLLSEDSAAGRIIPITPFRALDTRVTGGRPEGSPAIPGQKKGPLKGGEPITLDLAGHGILPAGISGVTGNVTVVASTYSGYVRLYPAGSATTTSALNFSAGEVTANAFTCGTSAEGMTAVGSATTAGTLHLIVDITAFIT